MGNKPSIPVIDKNIQCAVKKKELSDFTDNVNKTQHDIDTICPAAEATPQVSVTPQYNQPTQCMVKKVEWNTANRNAELAKFAVDTACPEEKRQREAQEYIQSANAYVQTARIDLGTKNTNYEKTKELYNRVLDVFNPIRQYISKLKNEIDSMENKVKDYDQSELAKRRKFLDEDPQSGVSGLPGLRTYDDKILLAFIIIFGIFLLSLSILALQRFGNQLPMQQKIGLVTGFVFAGYFLAYYTITIYG